VARDEVSRGDVIVAAGASGTDRSAAGAAAGSGAAPLTAGYRVDVALEWASPDRCPEGGTRVAVHHGTRETAARLAELGGRYFQLRLEQPLVPARGDRVVIRSLAPPDTLGGGVVLDPDPPRHGPSRDLLARLARLERGEPEPAAPAPAPAEPPAAKSALAPLSPAALELEARLRAAGHEPPPDAELPAEALTALRAHGRITRLGRGMHIHRDALADVARLVTTMIERDGPLTLAALRDELGTSRRYAQALLEALDAERVTLRVGDERLLRKKSS
jgi:selenocysteine-specific elongation factor